MNLGIPKRTILRHRYVKNRPAYESFLEHMDAYGDVWKVPQREVATWWEARQAAVLELRVTASGNTGISCSLKDSVVEIDGKELRIPPFEISIPCSLERGEIGITFDCETRHVDFLREVLGHLGYGHLTQAHPPGKADIGRDMLTPVLQKLRETALLHWNYSDEDIAALRGLVRRAHHERGIPELRLWTLPHRGRHPYRVCVSSRFDVDKAIINMPLINELEAKHGLRSTAYLRPMGLFYGSRDIRRFRSRAGGNEIALHGEFVTSARQRFGDEFQAAIGEKKRLEWMIGQEVAGVCMHGGELSHNFSQNTRAAIEAAQFKYETMYRNNYYLPLHLPIDGGVMRTLSIGQHFADLNVTPDRDFAEELLKTFIDRFSKAAAVGGVFVPVLHPLYFDAFHYLCYPENLYRLGAYLPKYVVSIVRMRRKQNYVDQT